MFSKLKNKIIFITMAITTTVIVLSGMMIVLFSSTTRPEPRPRPESDYAVSATSPYSEQELQNYIQIDRQEGNKRLLITLFCVGAAIEIIVFLIVYFASQKIVEPVKKSYDNQKLFIANASHELKTPLAVIQANIEALNVDKENTKWKSNIENEIKHANRLVLDLLQLAKMDASSAKNAAEKINLNTEIKRRIEIFKPKFSGKISFRSTTGASVQFLPKQDILQILDILLDNATKYGHQKISLSLNKTSLIVSNDGTSIPKDDLEKVFDRFYQTDKTKDGSGLGLAIAKALCEQNNWHIRCESTNQLTKFTVSWC